MGDTVSLELVGLCQVPIHLDIIPKAVQRSGHSATPQTGIARNGRARVEFGICASSLVWLILVTF